MRRSHIACHAAGAGVDSQRKLRIDPTKEEFIGDDEANGLRSQAGPRPLCRLKLRAGDISILGS